VSGKTKATRLRLTEGGIFDLLRIRYAPPAWAIFSSIGDATGWRKSRTADAVAMSLWPSRGLNLHGFEIKSHRGDWTREKDTPDKAEEIASLCDFWWIVAEADVVKDGEVPDAWGWLEVTPKGTGYVLTMRKQAVQTEAKPLTHSFLAAFLRRVQEETEIQQRGTVPYDMLQTRLGEERKKGEESERVHLKYDLDKAEKLRETVKRFQECTGIEIGSWDSSIPAATFNVARAFVEGTRGMPLRIDGLIQELGKLREKLIECNPFGEEGKS